MNSFSKIRTKHTLAPWISEGSFIGTGEEDPQTIAYISDHRNRKQRSDKETQANINLITSAPELLDAAIKFVARMENSSLDDIEETLWGPSKEEDKWAEYILLKKAIKKALGKE